MKLLHILSLALTLAGLASAEWPHLRTTFGVPGVIGFDPNPRTQDELDAEGWVLMEGCADGNSVHPGDRYVRNGDDLDVVLVFDGNGFIAGIQTVVPIEKTYDDANYPFSSTPYYQRGSFFGQDVFYTTVYFVDPAIICNGGRSQFEFNSEGTGNRISLQNGPDPLNDLVEIPLTQSDMLNEANWYEHKCFRNMGIHFFSFNKDPDQSCDETVPFQVVYDEGNLNGVVFQHLTDLDSSRFETVTRAAINGIVDTPPTCLYDVIDSPGLRAMHVYVDNYNIRC